MTRDLDLAVRVASLPLLGALSLVGRLRDQAARSRVRDDESAADWAVSWDRLTPELRALANEWTSA